LSDGTTTTADSPSHGWLARLGVRLSDWFEHWFPDAFSLALLAVCVVFLACVAAGSSPTDVAQWFGAGYWDLVAFTMQMTLIVVSGYALATAPPVHGLIRRIASIPASPRGAIVFVALFSMLSSLVSWSFSLIFSGLLARAVAWRVERADYRAIGAAAYLGVGSVWALGLSSSAALIMATPASLPASIASISGVIPLSQTIGLWQGMAMAAVLIGVSMAVAYYSAPAPGLARGMRDMGVEADAPSVETAPPARPGEWLEHSPVLSLAVGLVGAAYVIGEIASRGPGVVLDLNHYIFLFLIAALLLHWRPRSFVAAVSASVPSVAGVLVQYPLYAGIVKMMTESGLARHLAEFFVTISTAHTFPVLVGIYSAFLGIFIPSAGGKWIVEAPYLLDAATTLRVHLGWVVQTYNATEALANLIHPFWMLPLLGILGLKPRDIVGYSVLQFVVHVPVVLFLVWAFNYTLTYLPAGTP
jgi:short-chain fatty acids transporter